MHGRPSDFVLLSKDQSYIEMLDPRPEDNFDILHYNLGSDMQNQFPDFASNAYDSYPPSAIFSTNNPNCYNSQDSVLVKSKEISISGQRQMPTGSTPSPSVSQSLDHPPSTLSSASGASARSTTSSAVGSPYSLATSNVPGQEHWIDSQQGLGIAAGIVPNESYGPGVYPLNQLEHDLVLSGDKFSNHFVGELERFSSSSISNSGPFLQTSVPPTAMAPLMLDTNVVSREITREAITHGANDKIDTPTYSISPASTSISHTSQCHQPTTKAPSPSQSNGSFKSPTTPASAYSPLTPCTISPSSARKHAFHRHSRIGGYDSRALGIPRRASGTSHCWSPYDRPVPSSKSPGHFNRDQTQSPFFGQSSGRFIAPLESSCWFSLTVFAFPFSLPFSFFLFPFSFSFSFS